jgi:hypothetical protein
MLREVSTNARFDNHLVAASVKNKVELLGWSAHTNLNGEVRLSVD